MVSNSDRARRQAALWLFYFFLAVVIAVRFAWLVPRVFFGDDLRHLLLYRAGQCGARLTDLLTSVCFEKFRPVFTLFTDVTFGAFDAAIPGYVAVNVLMQAASGMLVFLLARRLAGSLVAAAVLAIAFCASRFAMYQVIQVEGPVEGLPLLFCLVGLYALAKNDGDSDSAWRGGWIALAMSALALSSHERYLTLPIAFGAAFLLLPTYRAMPRGRLATLLVASVAIPALSSAYKQVFLHTAVLVGTGGSHIDVDPDRILGLFHDGVSSIFGLNDGPEYLVSAPLSALPWFPAWVCAGLILGIWVAVSAAAARKAARIGARESGLAATFLVTGAALLAPALSTVLLDQRWLLAPFTMVLLVLAWASGVIGRSVPVMRWLPAVAFATSSLVLDALIMRQVGNHFLVYSARFADAVKRDVLDRGYEQGTSLVVAPDQGFCNWVLYGSAFFELYGGGRQAKCVTDTEGLSPREVAEGGRVFAFRSPPTRLVDITVEAGNSRAATVRQ